MTTRFVATRSLSNTQKPTFVVNQDCGNRPREDGPSKVDLPRWAVRTMVGAKNPLILCQALCARRKSYHHIHHHPPLSPPQPSSPLSLLGPITITHNTQHACTHVHAHARVHTQTHRDIRTPILQILCKYVWRSLLVPNLTPTWT